MTIQLMAQHQLVCALLLVSVLMSVEVQDINALTCRVCRNALYLDDCTEQHTCSHNEECYVQEVITPSLQIVYNAGCGIREQMCHGNSSTNVGLIACARCCDTPGNSSSHMECNSQLCGLNNSHLLGRDVNQCYFCGDDDSLQGPVDNGRQCRKIKFCAQNEVCFVSTIHSGGRILHQFGCARKLQCQLHTIQVLERLGISTGINVPHLTATGELTFIGRKRTTELCYICCGGGLCNDDDCWNVKDILA